MRDFPYLISGAWKSSGEKVEIRSPIDGSVVGQTWLASRDELNEAIAAAVRAFSQTREMSAFERRQILEKISAMIGRDAEEFVELMVLEAGKPVKAARAEVNRAVFTFAVAAEEAGRIGGEILPLDLQASGKGRWGLVRWFPAGPIAAITPFNFPLNLVAHKLAPAIAAGCPVVLKPAPQTPLTALKLAKVVLEAGWPAEALHVLPLSNETAAALVEDERLKVLTFTGSAPVGWALKSRAGKKRVLLELGGNAGVIVHSDADVEKAAARCAAGGFSYSGQSCISVQRIFVQAQRYQEFLQLLVKKVKELRVGDPRDESTDVGPLIRESDAVRIEEWIREAVAGGAKLLCGGERSGAMVQPAVLTETGSRLKVRWEEVFGPVVTVDSYGDFDAALAMVNDSRYGLQAGVFTNDARLIFRAYRELEVGGLTVNEVPTFRIDHMPYGGVKDSGLGREGLRYAIEEMCERKLLITDF